MHTSVYITSNNNTHEIIIVNKSHRLNTISMFLFVTDFIEQVDLIQFSALYSYFYRIRIMSFDGCWYCNRMSLTCQIQLTILLLSLPSNFVLVKVREWITLYPLNSNNYFTMLKIQFDLKMQFEETSDVETLKCFQFAANNKT